MRKLIRKALKKQTGFSLVSAVFIVVILGLIGGYIVSISALTGQSMNLSSLGVKAYYAAKSGLEWGIYQVAPSGGVAPFNCPASPTTLTFTQNGLSGLSAVVTCSSNSFTEYGITYKVFQINAMGSYGTPGNVDYVSRRLYTTVMQPTVPPI